MRKTFFTAVLILLFAAGAPAQCPYPEPIGGCEGATINMDNNTVNGDVTFAATYDLKILGNAYANWAANPPKTVISGFNDNNEWTLAGTKAESELLTNGSIETFDASCDPVAVPSTCVPAANWVRDGVVDMAKETSIIHTGGSTASIKVFGGAAASCVGNGDPWSCCTDVGIGATCDLSSVGLHVTNLSLVPGRAYRFSSWIYGDATAELQGDFANVANPEYPFLGVVQNDSTGFTVPAAWNNFANNFVGHSTNANAFVRVRTSSDNAQNFTFYIDDVSVKNCS